MKVELLNEDVEWHPFSINITIQSLAEYLSLVELFDKEIYIPGIMREQYDMQVSQADELKRFFEQMYNVLIKADRFAH